MKTVLSFRCALLLAALALAGCTPDATVVLRESKPPRVEAGQGLIVYATNAPELAFIAVEPAAHPSAAVSHATGRLYWNDDVTVRVFTPVAGRVVALHADVGEMVAAGTPLADLDSPDYGQALASARTAVANLAAAGKSYRRSQELLQHGAAAQKDVEAAEAAYAAAQAERDRAEAVLANYGGTDKGTNSIYILRSPLAGELVERNVTPGQELRADLMLANAPNLFAPSFVISDPTKLWLQIDVPETDLAALQKGQHLRISTPAFPRRTFDGTLQNIGETMDPATRTVRVRGVVNNSDKLLKAEMYVTVDLTENAQSPARGAVEVSSKALFMKGADSFLFVEETPGHFQRKQVVVGMERDGKVPILEGVAAGDNVVIEGALLLQAVLEPAS
jgi:cobalt-zinc-cadmium efflux system membrane fusion protein